MNLAQQLQNLTAAVEAPKPKSRNYSRSARDEALRPYRLAQAARSQTEWSQTVLAALGEEAVKGSTLAQRLHTSRATAYRWLVALETAGYVTRTGYNNLTLWSKK